MSVLSICLKIGVTEIVTTLQCNHLFHVECISKWLRENHNTYPMCRYELYEVVRVYASPRMSTRGNLRVRGRRFV